MLFPYKETRFSNTILIGDACKWSWRFYHHLQQEHYLQVSCSASGGTRRVLHQVSHPVVHVLCMSLSGSSWFDKHFQSLIYISSFIISYWCVCLENTAYRTIIPMLSCYMAGVLLCLCLQVRQLVFKMFLKTQSNTEFRYAAQTE